MTVAQIAVYVHIPFCRRKCHYCDFASYAGMDRLIGQYVAAVAVEAGRHDHLSRALPPADAPQARTVYFGGGTPTLLDQSQFERLIAALPPRLPGAEVTVEANPATVTLDTLRGLRGLGVNRLSIGVQSFDDALLRRLGRQHDAAEAVESFDLARRAGLDNVSVDLIYGLPDQSLAHWRATLERALALAPEHLSLYALTVEENTAFGRLRRLGRLSVPDEDAQADMYILAEDMLAGAGYEHYEISNWAAVRDGRPVRAEHNLVYWRNEPYLGLGAAAHSFYQGRRFANTPRVRAYIAAVEGSRSPVVQAEEIDPALEMAETMMLGLRLSEGVSRQRFRERFGRELQQCYGDAIRELSGLGLLTVTPERVALSLRGRLLGNEAFARFLSPSSPVL